MLDTDWLCWLHDHGAHETGGEQYSKTLYLLADSINAKTILEIGAGWGHSAAAFAASMSKREDCKLISVDPQPERLLPACREFVATSGVYWHVIADDSAKVNIDDDVDLLYIDGDPFRAREDFDRYFPRVKAGGLVVFDGYYMQGGPTEAVDDLQKLFPFGVIPYSHKGIIAMAIHRKELPAESKHTLKCDSCGLSSLHFSYPDARSMAETHLKETGHAVSIY